jgi:hypothetical protein
MVGSGFLQLPTVARAVDSAARSGVFNIAEATHDG